jgi:MoaA/NifB/PqqE/SkfB family radical SAM enzyme
MDKKGQGGIHQGLILDGHKLAWHKDRVEAYLAGERVAPITIDCALTRSCTYRCLYCYGQLQENDEKKMTRDVIISFLDDAASLDVKAVSFVSDGESTCSPWLYEAITHGKKNGLDMALGTNGYLLDTDQLESILPSLSYLRFNMSAGEPMRYKEIHGCSTSCFSKVFLTILKAVQVKKENDLDVTIGIQMVLMPSYADQIIPFATIGKELGVDYAIIKHCSDDEMGTLGVDYEDYFQLGGILAEAEKMSTEDYTVKAKWSKIMSNGQRHYDRCYGPGLIMQLSGSGLVAPCGMLFNQRFKDKCHIDNITETSFRRIFQNQRYWDVLDYLGSGEFDARKECGSLCIQHHVNECLFDIKHNGGVLERNGDVPMHVNFI